MLSFLEYIEKHKTDSKFTISLEQAIFAETLPSLKETLPLLLKKYPQDCFGQDLFKKDSDFSFVVRTNDLKMSDILINLWAFQEYYRLSEGQDITFTNFKIYANLCTVSYKTTPLEIKSGHQLYSEKLVPEFYDHLEVTTGNIWSVCNPYLFEVVDKRDDFDSINLALQWEKGYSGQFNWGNGTSFAGIKAQIHGYYMNQFPELKMEFIEKTYRQILHKKINMHEKTSSITKNKIDLVEKKLKLEIELSKV